MQQKTVPEGKYLLLFFRQGETGWMEFITPDKNTFIQQYKVDPETIRWDSETDLMKPLAQHGQLQQVCCGGIGFFWQMDK